MLSQVYNMGSKRIPLLLWEFSFPVRNRQVFVPLRVFCIAIGVVGHKSLPEKKILAAKEDSSRWPRCMSLLVSVLFFWFLVFALCLCLLLIE